ncbi:MAG: sulfur carrier protein ThiS [Actinomycetota bacterium]|nr:sulfur carrier protein ThiS [Actinomycetota bacterium]
MPTVLLNGESIALPEGATAADAVQATGMPENGRGVAVALDGQVVPRREWKDTRLIDGGQVEVLRAVQGG